MRGLATKFFILLTSWSVAVMCPAMAHVKWFLSKPESELLKQPKPTLFTQWGFENIAVVIGALLIMFVLYSLNLRYGNWLGSRQLMNWAQKHEPVINLLMAIGLGSSLIYGGLNHTLLVPNFIICSHCPQWLVPTEIVVGTCLIFGLMGRLSGLAILGLMYMAICKHGLIECLDILPLAGLAVYFVLSGRNKMSLDSVLGLDKMNVASLNTFGHYCVRTTMGLGLIALAISEKLMHPQLAMDLLQHSPALNPLAHLGISDPMFVLLSGLTEMLLGLAILVGCFPRYAVLGLLGIFCATTSIFGWQEFLGHAACYGSILSIALWGNCMPSFQFVRELVTDVRTALIERAQLIMQ